MTFDVELFIIEVERRPVIWDSRNKDYSNKNEKRNAWEEMCKKFVPDFENKTVSEKNECATQLQKKWKNIRDCYTRELNKRKASKSGSAAETHKQYVYFDMLNFLTPVTATKPTELEDADAHTDEINSSDVQDGVASISRKRRKMTEEEKLLQVLATNIKKRNSSVPEADDPDKYFLLSLLDDFKSVPQHLKMDAKFEIMSVLRKYSRSYSSVENYNIHFTSQVPMPVYSNPSMTVLSSTPSPSTSNRDATLSPLSSDSSVVTDFFSG